MKIEVKYYGLPLNHQSEPWGILEYEEAPSIDELLFFLKKDLDPRDAVILETASVLVNLSRPETGQILREGDRVYLFSVLGGG